MKILGIEDYSIELNRNDLTWNKTDKPINEITIYDFKYSLVSNAVIRKASLIIFNDGDNIVELKNKYRII